MPQEVMHTKDIIPPPDNMHVGKWRIYKNDKHRSIEEEMKDLPPPGFKHFISIILDILKSKLDVTKAWDLQRRCDMEQFYDQARAQCPILNKYHAQWPVTMYAKVYFHFKQFSVKKKQTTGMRRRNKVEMTTPRAVTPLQPKKTSSSVSRQSQRANILYIGKKPLKSDRHSTSDSSRHSAAARAVIELPARSRTTRFIPTAVPAPQVATPHTGTSNDVHKFLRSLQLDLGHLLPLFLKEGIVDADTLYALATWPGRQIFLYAFIHQERMKLFQYELIMEGLRRLVRQRNQS